MDRASLVLGIVAIVTSFIPILNFFAPSIGIVGITLAVVSRRDFKTRLNTIGLATSIIGILCGFIMIFTFTFLASRLIISKVDKEPSKISEESALLPLSSYDLPTFKKTIGGDKTRLMKVAISLEHEQNEELTAELEKRENEISSNINKIIQHKKYEDLDSVTDTVELAEEIKVEINDMLDSGEIREVHFKEFQID